MKQILSPSVVAEGREEDRAEEAGKGLEKTRDVHTPHRAHSITVLTRSN